MNESDLYLTRQQEILEQYFQLIAQFSFDKGKDLVECDRDKQRCHHSSILSCMLTALAQLSNADKNYMNLNFLAPKGLFRKDQVKAQYSTLQNEFERLEERGSSVPLVGSESNGNYSYDQTTSPKTSPLSTSSTASTSSSIIAFVTANVFPTALISPSSHSSSNISNAQLSNSPIKATLDVLDRLSAHICGQLLHYVRARIEMMEIYEKITVIAHQKFCIFDELITSLSELIKSNSKHFHHPILDALKTGFRYECDVLLCLLRAQTDIQMCRFLTVTNLVQAQTKLNAWLAMCVSRDSPTRKLQLSRTPSLPPLCQWLSKLKSSLASKYALYFSTALSAQNPNNFASICASKSIDYISKIQTFHRKNDAQSIGLIFDSHGVDDFKGFGGYYSPLRAYEPPRGMDTIPVIYCYPQESDLKTRMHSIIMIMNKHRELNINDNTVSVYDSMVSVTFFLCRPDPRITLVVLFDGKKSDKDSYVLSFMQEICLLLKGSKIFASLKPGVK